MLPFVHRYECVRVYVNICKCTMFKNKLVVLNAFSIVGRGFIPPYKKRNLLSGEHSPGGGGFANILLAVLVVWGWRFLQNCMAFSEMKAQNCHPLRKCHAVLKKLSPDTTKTASKKVQNATLYQRTSAK